MSQPPSKSTKIESTVATALAATALKAPKALLILDIDGVLNPYYASYTLQKNPELLPGFEEHQLEDGAYGKASAFLQTSALKSQLSELKSQGVEFVWGSAWNESSNLILDMLFPSGEQHWPTIVFPDELDYSLSLQTWKLATVREFIETNYSSDVPLIWLEDEIFADAREWALARNSNSLLVCPERHRGVTEADWQRVLDFAKSL